MAGKTYATKGYSTYTDIPPQGGGFGHEPKHLVNRYAVETKTIRQVRGPTARYTDFVGSPSKAELLKEYVHSPSASVSPKHNQNSSSPVCPNKQLFSSPGRGYFSNESSRSGINFKTGNNISGSNKSCQTAGPSATLHSLTTSTNHVNEALLEESVYYSPRADPRRRGVLDELSTRAQPLEPQKRYARPVFVAKPNDVRHDYTNTRSGSDSYEAMRRYGYRGSLKP